MSNFVRIIKDCESAEGAGSKLAIREALSGMDETARRLIWEALNPYRVWGTKTFTWPAGFPAKSMTNFDTFFTLLDRLASGDLRPNSTHAKSEITTTLAQYDQETATYLARVIDKDLKAGFSDETVNKVLLAMDWMDESNSTFEDALKAIDKLLKVEGYEQFAHYPNHKKLIPVYKVQLADKPETEEDYDNQEYPCDADVKYDGERNGAMVEQAASEPVLHYSRSGKIAEHMAGIFDEQLMWMRERLGYDFFLDGERMSTDFTGTMNAKKSGDNEARKALIIRAYFLMPLAHWKAQRTNITMKQSRAMLQDLLAELQAKFGADTRIFLSEGREVKDHHDMMSFANDVIDGKFNGRKEEGLILKRKNDVYRWERNSAWMKIKRFYPVDLTVVGWYYGNPGSRNAKRLGGVIVEGIDENGKKIRARVGSGFNDPDRDNPDQFKNVTLEIKYQDMTQSAKMKGTDIHSLRFLTVERVRDDKNVEALQEQRWWGVSLKEAVKVVNDAVGLL